MPKPRRFDRIPEERRTLLWPYAQEVRTKLRSRMLQWDRLLGKRTESQKANLIQIELAKLYKWFTDNNHPIPDPDSFEIKLDNPKSIARGRILFQILQETLPDSIFGYDYTETCRDVCSIMSIQTHREQEEREIALEKSIQTNPPKKKKRKHKPKAVWREEILSALEKAKNHPPIQTGLELGRTESYRPVNTDLDNVSDAAIPRVVPRKQEQGLWLDLLLDSHDVSQPESLGKSKEEPVFAREAKSDG